MTNTAVIASDYTNILIDGEWCERRSGKTFMDLEPATGERLATVAAGNAEDVSAAVMSAQRAFRAGQWARISPTERGHVLYRIVDLIRHDEFAKLEAADVGKLLPDAQAEVEYAADLFDN